MAAVVAGDFSVCAPLCAAVAAGVRVRTRAVGSEVVVDVASSVLEARILVTRLS